MSRYARHKKDRVHREIMQALIACGAEVEDFSAAGKRGIPDLHVCVRYANGARLYWLEVKSPESVLKKDGTDKVIHNATAEAQAKWARRFPTHRVTSIDEALAVVGMVVR